MLEASAYPVQLIGERLQPGPFLGDLVLFETEDAKGVCEDVELDGGERSEPSTGGYLLQANYLECELDTVSVNVDMDTCMYLYTNVELVKGGEYVSDASIICKEGHAIKIADPGGSCNLTIPPQAFNGVVGTINYTLGGQDVILGSTGGSGMKYTAKGFGCVLLGIGEGTFENASSKLDTVLRGDA